MFCLYLYLYIWLFTPLYLHFLALSFGLDKIDKIWETTEKCFRLESMSSMENSYLEAPVLKGDSNTNVFLCILRDF